MSRASVLARGRAAAARGMRDACLVERRTSQTTNDLTGVVTPVYSTLYTGACRVQLRGVGGQAESGETTVMVTSPELQLPIAGTETITRGDRVTITAAVNDAALVGRVYMVTGTSHESESTTRRVTIEEAT